MTSEALQSFVRDHPVFFSRSDGYLSLRTDLKEAMEQYARSVNPEEYERVSALIEQVRAEERARLWELSGRWREEMEACEERLRGHQEELRTVEQQLVRAMDALLTGQPSAGKLSGTERQWYHSGLVYWILAFVGVLFLYLGIFVEGSAAFTFLLGGISAVLTGGYLQLGGMRRRQAVEVPHQLSEAELRMHKKLLRLAKVKRAAILERKKIAKSEHALLAKRISENQRKINLLHG